MSEYQYALQATYDRFELVFWVAALIIGGIVFKWLYELADYVRNKFA